MDTTDRQHIRTLIIGSGPAGYTAAIYASRANLSPVLYEGLQPGGQLTTTTEVENFPGYPDGITGPQLMDDLRRQAAKFGADIRPGRIAHADFSVRPFSLKADDGTEISADTVIIATGATAMYLGRRPWSERMRHMRRILLPRPHGGCGGWRRHRLRGSPVSGQPCVKSLHDSAQTVSACIESDAEARVRQRED